MYYNFVRTHQTLRMTPAMAAGVETRPFEIADIVAILEQWEVGADEIAAKDREARNLSSYSPYAAG